MLWRPNRCAQIPSAPDVKLGSRWWKLLLAQSLDLLISQARLIVMIDHGDLTMRKRSLLFLSLLVPAFLGLGGYAALKAQQKTLDGQREALVRSCHLA